MRKFFDSIDTDHNGWISKTDLASGLERLGIDCVDDVFEHLSHEDPERITYFEIDDAFRKFREQPPKEEEEEEEEEEKSCGDDETEQSDRSSQHDTLSEFFDSIDIDGKGWVTRTDLSSGLQRFGVEKIERVIKHINTDRVYFKDMKEAFSKLYEESQQRKQQPEDDDTMIFEATVRSEKLESRSQSLRDEIEELKKDRDKLARRISFQNEYIEDQKIAFQRELEVQKTRVETRSSSIVLHLQKELDAQREMILDTEIKLERALSSQSLEKEHIPIQPPMSRRPTESEEDLLNEKDDQIELLRKQLEEIERQREVAERSNMELKLKIEEQKKQMESMSADSGSSAKESLVDIVIPRPRRHVSMESVEIVVYV